jgi:Ferritin-like domain
MPQPHADTTQRGEKIVLSTRNDLGVEVREKATALLNQHLADATDLYSQTKQAHWNVKGMQFSQLHELFDTLADSVEEFVDLIAERPPLSEVWRAVRFAYLPRHLACPNTRSTRGMAGSTWRHSQSGSRSWLRVHVPPLMRRTRWETPIPATSSRRFHEVWTSTCGSWSPTSLISALRLCGDLER